MKRRTTDGGSHQWKQARCESPSIAPGSTRAAEIVDGPLAAALLPTALLEAPPTIQLRLGEVAADGSGASLVAHAIAERGLCHCRCGLSPALGAAARAEAASLYADGNVFATKGFVKEGRRVPPDAEQRADLCVMLSDDPDHELHSKVRALLAIDAAIERFAHATVEQLGLLEVDEREPLGSGPGGERLSYSSRGDLMLAVYPGHNSFHRVHIDNADGDGRAGRDFGRVLTFIYYLNDGWTREDGGALRLHLPRDARGLAAAAARAAGRSPAIDVLPRLDSLAVFRADRVMHEVRPCPTRHRYAASMWICCGSAADHD